MVEVAQRAVLAAHMPSAIEEENNLLIAFVLKLTGNGGALTGSGFPVDVFEIIAFTKLA